MITIQKEKKKTSKQRNKETTKNISNRNKRRNICIVLNQGNEKFR